LHPKAAARGARADDPANPDGGGGTMRVGTFCSGILAPEVAWHPLGWKPVFFSEIDPFACALESHHFPGVPNLGDMREVNGAALRGVADVWAAGTPCQDFSVAGKRAGFEGARGSLTFTFLELVKEGRPDWLVFENVPGILSGECEAGFYNFLDSLESLGYVIDVDVLDAQFHGLAQRRRRVFICAQHIDALLREKTTSSAQTIAQCLTESFLFSFAVLSDRSLTGYEDWGLGGTDAADSLKRRIKLFSLQRGERCETLLENLDALQPSSPVVRNGSASRPGLNATGDSRNIAGTRSVASEWIWDLRNGFPNTAQSWKTTLVDALKIANECTTSTLGSGTTESKIYTCAMATLLIAERITLSDASCPTYWSAESSALIALAEFTNYARSATQNLFAAVEWIQPWSDFIGQAERFVQSFNGPRNWTDSATLLSFLESLPRHSAPRRETGARVAASLTRGADGGGSYAGRRREDDVNIVNALDTCSGGPDDNSAQAGHIIPDVVGALSDGAHMGGGAAGTCLTMDGGDLAPCLIKSMSSGVGNTQDAAIIAVGGFFDDATHSLRADGFDASEDGTGRGTPLMPVKTGYQGDTLVTQDGLWPCIPSQSCNNGGGGGAIFVPILEAGKRCGTRDSARDGIGVGQAGDPMFTLQAVAQHAVAFNWQSGGDCRIEPREDHANALQRSQTQAVALGMGVRRLMPVETERLQGFPDGWTFIPYRGKLASDGPRYRGIGNSMATTVLLWIGRRIELVRDALKARSA
jgi:site-specific DNA-cytosine methylase